MSDLANTMDGMANGNDRMVWIDCEMTGLDVERDELVEVAVFVTDSELNLVDAVGLNVVINPSPAALEHMGDFVRDMHTKSGLIEEIPHGVSLAEAEERVLAYLKEHVPGPKTAPIAGNTIGTDRMFLSRYMPKVDEHLHYRSIDVSTLKELSRRWFPRVYFNAPPKDGGHRAAADILESIRELKYYRRAVLVAEPGPTSDEAKAISADVVADFAQNL